MRTKMGKPQTKQNMHQNLTTELLTLCQTSNLKFEFATSYVTFSIQISAKKAKSKNKVQITQIVYNLQWYMTLFNSSLTLIFGYDVVTILVLSI